MPQILANGITINYELSTPPNPDPELIVLINGLADDLTTWSAQTPAFLQAGYQVLSYDNRGIGGSSKPEGPYTAALFAEDLRCLLTELGVKRAHLVGVSMGGMVLQEFALLRDKGGVEVLSMVLACTYAQPTEFCSSMFGFWADVARKMSVQDVMRDVCLWAFTVPFFRRRTEDLEAVEEAMENLDMSLEAYLAQLNVIQKFDSTSRLDGLRAEGSWFGGIEPRRVMVLAGATDILIPVQLSRELAERIEGCVWRTTKGGHGCMWEFPHAFNEAVIGFLKDCKANV